MSSISPRLLLVFMLTAGSLRAQDLTPRAYIITPIHSNAIILTDVFSKGDITFNDAVPIEDASGNPNVGILSYYHSLSFFGRSANIVGSLPYGVGHFQGKLLGTQSKIYRSGLADAVFRFSVNLKGGPAMTPAEFRKWRQKTLIGASVTVVAPTGQYDPTPLVNLGTNRWAVKPDLGLSHRWRQWVVDTSGGIWLFATNHDYLAYNPILSPGRSNTFSQAPIAPLKGT
jgi:hypothetical protein